MDTWSKPNIENIIAKKKVDLSLFKYGIHIPLEYRKDFLSIIPSGDIPLGGAEKITLQFEDFSEQVDLRKINVKNRPDEVLQIRYDGNSSLIDYLKRKLKKSYNNIKENNSKTPDNIDEYIEFYKANKPYTLQVKLITEAADSEININIKEEFFKYIGNKDSLGPNYQKSYKPILLISLINNVNKEGKADYDKVCEDIVDFYLKRNKSGLPVESNNSKIVQNINGLSIAVVKSVMNENAYKVINDQGYIYKENVQDKEYLCFNKQLWSLFNSDDLAQLKDILYAKLDLYYKERVAIVGSNELKNHFQYVIDNYVTARTSEEFAGHKLGETVRTEIPDYLKKLDFIDNNEYVIKGSIGQGNWAKVPWVAIMGKSITTTTQKGVYVVYLFSETMDKLYLTLNQGVTEFDQKYKKDANKKLQENADNIRSNLNLSNADLKASINLGDGNLGKSYEAAAIATIEYDVKNLPDDNILKEDLFKIMKYYKTYVAGADKKVIDEIIPDPEENRDVIENVNPKEIVNQIYDYIISKGYIYSLDSIQNFYLSLKTKPFVILAGISGTGKSKIARLFAEAIGANVNNGRFKMISVKPDWNDSTELFGYKNINDEFIPGKLTEIIKEATENINMPYFVCIDEMNLARVEYYLSEYLSLIESRKVQEDEIATDKIFNSNNIKSDYSNLYIPGNLYIIGTVNMDDTTFQFSRKVLDRANTIEFSEVDLNKLFINNAKINEAINKSVNNDFIKTDYLSINDIEEQYREYASSINTKIITINEILKKARRHFAYRVRDEIIFYMVENKKLDLMDEKLAFDYQIMQKILPAISGSEAIIKDILVELFNFCLQKESVLADTSYLEDAEKYLKDAVYSKSASKILDMLRGYKYDGFATYWF